MAYCRGKSDVSVNKMWAEWSSNEACLVYKLNVPCWST